MTSAAVGELTLTSRLKGWLQLVRLPAVFSAWSNTIAAHFIALGGFWQPSQLAIQLLISTCFFWAGMILNDYFDYAEDARERPFRPLPSGRVSRSAALIVAVSLIGAGLILALYISLPSLIIALALGLLIWRYDASQKKGNVAAATMGSCRYVHWLLGLSIVPLSLNHFLIPIPVLLYIMAVTWLSQQETRADNKSDLNRVIYGIGCAAAAVVLLGCIFETAYALLAIAGVSALALTWIVVRLRHDFTPASLQKGVMTLLIFSVVLDSAIMMVALDTLWALALLLLALPGKFVGRWLYAS